MEAIRCLNCGSHEVEKTGGMYRCKHCGISYEDDRAEAFAESVRSIFGNELAAQKEEQIANCRRNLWKAMHAENISSKEVEKWSGELKKLLPDDFMANFAEYACDGDARRLNEFLDEADMSENGIFATSVLDFLLKGMEYSTVLPLKNMIERSLKGADYRKYVTALEEEADKIKEGVYSTQVPRDVFVAYSSKDYKAVNEIVEFLENNGISCFVALRNLRHGKGAAENYGNALQEAMHNCKCVVFLSSNNSRSLDCDALKVELPYIRDYEPKMGRIEYILEDYTKTGYAAKRICESFFGEEGKCRTSEELLDMVLEHITGFGEEEAQRPAGNEETGSGEVKYCLNCGAEAPAEAKFCTECGNNEFAETYEEYLRAKIEGEFKQKYISQFDESGETDGMSDEVRDLFLEASAGDAAAQVRLGDVYESGRGVKKDEDKAFEWYKKAADQGDAVGMYTLAGYYKHDKRYDSAKSKQLYDEAAVKFKKAADRGDAEAQYFLGRCYMTGNGVKKDEAIGAEWILKAADQGLAIAQYDMGSNYSLGQGVKRDCDKAYEYYKKAADQGHLGAIDCVGYCYDMGEGVEEDKDKAYEWYRKAADLGYAYSQYNVGNCYYAGDGVERDLVEAKKWYLLAASNGDQYAEDALKKPDIMKIEIDEDELFKPEPVKKPAAPVKKPTVKKEADNAKNTTATAKSANATAKSATDTAKSEAAKQQPAKEATPASKQPAKEAAPVKNSTATAINEADTSGTRPVKDTAADKPAEKEEEKRAAEEFAEHLKKAKAGDAKAQYAVGECYECGDGVEEDKDKAAEWYKKSAEQGYAEAQYALGSLYYWGDIEKDYDEAVKWYTKAAEQGLAIAQWYLAQCYECGDGVEENQMKAVEWYTKAAKQGYDEAQYELGHCYFKGEGVPQDLGEAKRWFEKAAAQGNKDAKDMQEDRALKDVTADSDPETECMGRKAKECLKKAKAGDPDAQYEIGEYYNEGKYYVTQDLNKAQEWFKKAAKGFAERAEKGDYHALYMLAECYECGDGVEKDGKRADELYKKAMAGCEKAAARGDARAQYRMGESFERGRGVEKNGKKAIKMYTQAAKNGNVDAQSSLGRCLYRGECVRANVKKGIKWYTKAAESGDCSAQLVIGQYYFESKHAKKDMKKAEEWLQKAAAQGEREAVEMLQEI